MLDAHLRAFDLTCSVGAEIPVFWGTCPFFCGLSSHIPGGVGWGWGGKDGYGCPETLWIFWYGDHY